MGSSDLWDNDCEYSCPSLTVCAAVGGWQPEEGDLLSLRTLWTEVETVGKKDPSLLSIKIVNLSSQVTSGGYCARGRSCTLVLARGRGASPAQSQGHFSTCLSSVPGWRSWCFNGLGESFSSTTPGRRTYTT